MYGGRKDKYKHAKESFLIMFGNINTLQCCNLSKESLRVMCDNCVWVKSVSSVYA